MVASSECSQDLVADRAGIGRRRIDTVMVVQELDTEEVVGTGTVKVETGTRDDNVSVDRLIIVRNEFAQVRHGTVSVKLSTTVAVVHELEVDSASGDVENELVSVKVSKMVV